MRWGLEFAWVAEIIEEGPKAGVYVEVRFLPGEQIGPCRIIKGIWTKDLRTKLDPTDGGAHYHEDAYGPGVHSHPHGHRLGDDLEVGDEVVVGFIGGAKTVPVVLGVLA